MSQVHTGRQGNLSFSICFTPHSNVESFSSHNLGISLHPVVYAILLTLVGMHADRYSNCYHTAGAMDAYFAGNLQ